MSTQRIPAPLATALIAAEAGDLHAFRAADGKEPSAPADEASHYAAARPLLVTDIRSARTGLWGGNNGKALLQDFKNTKASSTPSNRLDNGEAAQETLDGFEGRFRFSVPQPQPRPKLDI